MNSVADLRQQIARIREAGVRIHAVLWNVGSARLLGALIEQGDLPEFLSIEIVLSDVVPACHPESERGLDAILDFLPRADLPWFALCAGGNILPMIEPVIERGGHLSFGLGDWPYPELGQPTNAELTRAVAKRAKELGVETAGPREARSILGLAS